MSRTAFFCSFFPFFFTAFSCADSKGQSRADSGLDIDSGSDTGGDSDSDADWDGGEDGGQADAGEEICAESDIEIIAAPPQIMVLQDMSNSMIFDDNMLPLPEPTKWDQAKNALSNLLADFGDKIDFGFDRFPKDWVCGVSDSCMSDTRPENVDSIVEMLNTFEPEGGTPLYRAMERFLETDYAPNFRSGAATSYLVIVSDGADTCGIDSDPFSGPPGASALELSHLTETLLEKEIRTFVIGFGQGADPDQLSAIAAAGGTDLTTFMIAENQEELDDALESIAETVISCVYEIEPPEESDADMDKVDVYFDGEPVGLDPLCALDIGWTWLDDDKTRIKFCQAACDKIKEGLVDNIQIMYGCLPEPVVQ